MLLNVTRFHQHVYIIHNICTQLLFTYSSTSHASLIEPITLTCLPNPLNRRHLPCKCSIWKSYSLGVLFTCGCYIPGWYVTCDGYTQSALNSPQFNERQFASHMPDLSADDLLIAKGRQWFWIFVKCPGVPQAPSSPDEDRCEEEQRCLSPPTPRTCAVESQSRLFITARA